MANYGFDDLVVEIDDSGSTARALTAYITEVSGITVEALTEDSHSAGDSWAERVFTGLKQAAEVTISGFYDDTASVGPKAILDSLGDTRTCKFTYGSTKYTSFEAIIKTFDRVPGRGELSKFTATLVPTGTITEN